MPSGLFINTSELVPFKYNVKFCECIATTPKMYFIPRLKTVLCMCCGVQSKKYFKMVFQDEDY